jgi:hypothetical protein
MFGRRAAELVGVLIASLVSSFVTTQALSRPHDSLLYVLGAAVPLALLVIYWFWIEPRADDERVRARRLHKAVEDAIELSYRSDPGHGASVDAAGVGGVPNSVRRSFYERLDIADMFEPDHLEAAATLRARLDAGRELQHRLVDGDPDLPNEIDRWEELTAQDLRANSSGTWDSYAFSDPPIRSESDPANQRERLGYKLMLLESRLQDQEKRAAKQAKEGA